MDNLKTSTLLCWIFILTHLTEISLQDDDIAFIDELPLDLDTKISNIVPVHRLWGIPDMQAIVGKLFMMTVPENAFKGDIDYYEASTKNIGPTQEWPKWLEFDRRGILKGVPLSSDVGDYYLSITAVAPGVLYKSKDVFVVEVLQPGLDVPPPEEYLKNNCPETSDPIMLTILLDSNVQDINPKTRIAMIENIAGYLGLSSDKFYFYEARSSKDGWSFSDTFYFIEGLGHANKTSRTEFASISFQIGCGRRVNNEFKALVEKIKVEALDGTLSEVLLRPVVGWHARNELPIYYRGRRQAGSGDQYEEDEDDDDDYNEPITTTTTTSPHPHRHHHGEDLDLANNTELSPSEVQYNLPPTSLLIDYDEDIIATPTFIPERPTEGVTGLEPTKVSQTFVTATQTSPTNVYRSEKAEDRRRPYEVTFPFSFGSSGSSSSSSSYYYPDNLTDSSTASATTDTFSSANVTVDQSSTDFVATDGTRNFNASAMNSVTLVATTEEMEPRNFKPTIAHRLKKVAATAGKVLRFKVPENTFADIEDGSTSHMKLSLKTPEGNPIPSNFWIKFDPINREIMAIPLEEHVSKWEFELEATDKDGDSVSDTFNLQIQHHKGHRAVNFEFSARVAPTANWTHSYDWQERIVEALANVYGDSDASQITVRSVSQTHAPYVFTWTNDSLPRSYCPRNDIDNLYRIIADDDGDPTEAFRNAIGRGLSVKKISVYGIGQCESKSATPTSVAPQSPHTNFSPVPRNQIDQVNATAGNLLVFKVPEDTCYDPEDGGTRRLKVSLLNMDRTHLDPRQWLQFDSKNQEFYGVPMDSDVRSQEYQLVCEDREGLTANDGLIVLVRPRPRKLHSVEFTIALDVLYDSFLHSSGQKRKFVEKLAEIFGDATTDAISLASIAEGSTIVTWHNDTLPTDPCPTEEIHRLREVLINDDESMNERMVAIMGHEFPVISVGLEPAGSCQGELTVMHRPESPVPPVEDIHFPTVGAAEDYLLTFVVPAVLIALMLILAGIIACFFYRKRRNSKMMIGDDDEKQSFRNKGIPVIFQDELEEKPESENKCPVIMKEEKPPLPPPEYQKSHHSAPPREVAEDVPYQPPPPFTSVKEPGRNARPKPTPTYRKPPPYVPP